MPKRVDGQKHSVKMWLHILIDANAILSSRWYRNRYQVRIPARLHFFAYGLWKQLSPHPDLDLEEIRNTHPANSRASRYPLVYYLARSSGSTPICSIDREYLETHPHARRYERPLLVHLVRHGSSSGATSDPTLWTVNLPTFRFSAEAPGRGWRLTRLELRGCSQTLLGVDDTSSMSVGHRPTQCGALCDREDGAVMALKGDYQVHLTLDLHRPMVVDLSWLNSIITVLLGDGTVPHAVVEERLLTQLASLQDSLPPSWTAGCGFVTSISSEPTVEDRELGESDVRSLSPLRTPRLVGLRRVMILCHEDSLTGAPTFAWQLAQLLAGFGLEVTFMVLRSDLREGLLLDDAGPCSVVYLRDLVPGSGFGPPTWRLGPRDKSEMRDALQELRPDVVVVNSVCISEVSELASCLGFPVVLIVQEAYGFATNPQVDGVDSDSQIFRAMRAAALTVFPTAHSARVWVKTPELPANAVVIPTYRQAKHPAEDRVKRREELHLPLNRTIFLSASSFEERKRIRDVVRGFLLGASEGDLLFCIGPGWPDSPEAMTAQTLADGDPRVHFLGATNHIQAWIEAADVLILASEQEVMPMVLQEAALAGTLRISSRYPGHEALVSSDDSLLFPVGDWKALGQCISVAGSSDYGDLIAAALSTQTQRAESNPQQWLEGMQVAVLSARAVKTICDVADAPWRQ